MRRLPPRGAALVGTVGLLMVLGGGVAEGYPQAVLLEVGAAFLLVVPVLLFEQYVSSRLSEVQARTEQAVQDLTESFGAEIETVREELSRTSARLDEINDLTRNRIQRDAVADDAAIEAFEEHPSQERAVALLHRALEIGAITEHGVRVQLPELWERLRFAAKTAYDESLQKYLPVVLESLDGTRIAGLKWTEGEPPDEFMHRVAGELQRIGLFPGLGAFDATAIFRQLLHTLRLGISMRRHGSTVVGSPLVELPLDGQWAVTVAGLECTKYTYFVSYYRLREVSPDQKSFRQHVLEKTWVNKEQLHVAWDVAEALHLEGKPGWLLKARKELDDRPEQPDPSSDT